MASRWRDMTDSLSRRLRAMGVPDEAELEAAVAEDTRAVRAEEAQAAEAERAETGGGKTYTEGLTPVPWSLRTASEWSWRFLAVLLAVVAIAWLLLKLRLVVFPLIVAIFLTALLSP